MSFSQYYADLDVEQIRKESLSCDQDIDVLLRQGVWRLRDFAALISPKASHYSSHMQQLATQITRQRFGHTMKLFVPLYLSNYCYNRCTYCGFSMDLDYDRKVLSDAEILCEGRLLRDRGFQHLLILTGEAPDKAGVNYLQHAVTLLKPYFASIGIEVQPLKVPEYQQLIREGVDNLAVYQETYHRETYATVHLSGKKSLFDHRIDTPDRGGEAGFFRISIGALLGLYDWRFEAIALAHHVAYLKRKYWRSKLSIAFPRIQSMKGVFDVAYPVSDLDMQQFISAFRLVFPDLAISMSTRERPSLRDQLMGTVITDMSAESCTGPGGYAGDSGDAQFDISDDRSLQSICERLKNHGIDPMLKDWDMALSS